MKVALISMPWPIFSRPSVQLGVLKGYLQRVWPELSVTNFHPYLRVAEALGYDLYQKLSDTSWLAEGVSAAVLFPERRSSIKEFVSRLLKEARWSFPFEEVVLSVEETLQKYLSQIDWSSFNAVGFSVCLNQLCTSLWGARWLKSRYPQLPIIFGGSSCAGEMGKSLLSVFPFVDYVINGEGERPLKELLAFLIKGEPFPEKGVFYRAEGKVLGGGLNQLPSEEIPSPLYEDYLREVMSLPPEKRFFPLITLEASRGCWWFKCRFCNLNLQWKGFRPKPLPQVLKEIRAHAKAGFLDFAFMDNCLPVEASRRLFEELAKDGVDYRFFAELRAVYKREDYLRFRKGGLTWVQIGIEALSSSLLKRLQKGTTAIDNIAAMRHCEEAGLVLEGNLILEFPGSTPEEVAETLIHLDYVFPFRPLSAVSFWLGYESPVFKNPRQFGLKAIYPDPRYRKLFPKSVLEKWVPLAWGYRGDRMFQRKLWRPVREKMVRWQEAYSSLRKEKGPLLTYREGPGFLLLRQVLPNGKVLHHRLSGPSRDIYLFLTDIRTWDEIKARFSRLPEEKIWTFLGDLREKKLVFREGEKLVALAIRHQGKERD